MGNIWKNQYVGWWKFKRKRIKAKARKIGERQHLVRFAEKLSEREIKSETWFHKLWQGWWDEKKNEPFAGFIPDVISHKYKYIIEIDGSIHDRADIKRKDAIKTATFESLGYKVFRIRHLDEDAVKELHVTIYKLRGYRTVIRRKPRA